VILEKEGKKEEEQKKRENKKNIKKLSSSIKLHYGLIL
jgi:hypothetical protein